MATEKLNGLSATYALHLKVTILFPGKDDVA